MLLKKRLPILIFLVVVAVLGVVWCLDRSLPPQVEHVLRQPDTLELISLDPEKYNERFRDPNNPQAWKELGILKATTLKQREQIVGAFRDAVVLHNKGVRCFWPRHAIHAIRGAMTVDIVICFECCRAYAYVNNKRLPNEIPLSERGAEAFNQLLSNAKIPLPPKE